MELICLGEVLKEFWDLWIIRVCITLSLSLQIFLFLFAPLRRKTANMVVNFLIWSAYLLADWVPTLTAGLILKILSTSTANTTISCLTDLPDIHPGFNDDLLALWAACLLWHLGGSLSITAFALDDNELWFRHSTVMAVQFGMACYIFHRTLPKSRFTVPTIFALLGGFFSNVLRAKSMHLASLDKYRKDIVTEHDSLDYQDDKDLEVYLTILQDRDPSSPDHHIFVLGAAMQCFKFFKGLLVNIKCQPHEQQQIAKFFCFKASSENAHQLVSCELNFMYEMFYTNRIALARRFGSCCWLISFVSCTVVLGLFAQAEKQRLSDVDIRISNALFIVPLVQCLTAPYFLSYMQMSLFLRKVGQVRGKSSRDIFSTAKLTLTLMIIHLRVWARYICGGIRLRESQIKIKPDIIHKIDGTPIYFREWSESICSHNLISYCLKERPRIISRPYRPRVARICKIPHVAFQAIGRVVLFPGKLSIVIFRPVLDRMGLKDILDSAIYVSRDPFDKELWNFIFISLRSAAINNEAGKLISEAISDWALPNSNHSTKLLDYTKDVEYDECLLLWHIATELCYNTDDNNLYDGETSNNRVFSKMLSDYMLYLMVFQPSMMSTISGIFLRRYESTCKNILSFLRKIHVHPGGEGRKMKEACRIILSPEAESIQSDPENRDRSMAMLSRACTLTKELKELSEGERWTVLSRVWLKMLVYAARNCRGDIHARSLCRGGELLSLVWLLMAHLGLIDATVSTKEKSSEQQEQSV